MISRGWKITVGRVVRPFALFAKAGASVVIQNKNPRPVSPKKTERQGQGTLVSTIRKKGWASPQRFRVKGVTIAHPAR